MFFGGIVIYWSLVLHSRPGGSTASRWAAKDYTRTTEKGMMMDYATTVFLIALVVNLPIMGLLLWQMGLRNWRKWLLIIPSAASMDLDHFFLTNVPGFGVHPMPGQMILHVTHTIEFAIFEIALFTIYFFRLDPRRGRNLKNWVFPISLDYSKTWQYYLAWTIRILVAGVVMHWLMDLLIYTYYQKWNYLYISLVQYLMNPT